LIQPLICEYARHGTPQNKSLLSYRSGTLIKGDCSVMNMHTYMN